MGTKSSFDATDRSQWYFGSMVRIRANQILMAEPSGVFLVRVSPNSGDHVLSVREEHRVSHYIVKEVPGNRLLIGQRDFDDMAQLLEFYGTHFLESTELKRPAAKPRLIAKYEFKGHDDEDLSFGVGEHLNLVCYDQKDWWRCANSAGQEGMVPANYVVSADEVSDSDAGNISTEVEGNDADGSQGSGNTRRASFLGLVPPPQLPAWAVALRSRVPNVYDRQALRFNVGDRIWVTAIDPSGMWTGNHERSKKVGIFPFSYVQFAETESHP